MDISKNPRDYTISSVSGQVWRQIYFAPDYLVSIHGEVLSLKARAPRILRPSSTPEGYLSVTMNRRRHYVHRLVLLTFDGPPPSDDHVADHLDFDVTNNSISNLRWLPSRTNAARKRTNAHLFH